MAKQDTELMSTRQAAEKLGISLRSAQLWVERGVLKAWKTPGGHRRILRESVDAVLADRAKISGHRDGRLSVLVVEDDPPLRRLYELVMSDWPDLDLRLAVDGFDGLLQVGARMPDLLIADLSMPGMDGFEMIRRLRAEPQLAEMEIVVVSALDPAEIERNGSLPSHIEVLTKPIPFDQLRRTVDRLRDSEKAYARTAAAR